MEYTPSKRSVNGSTDIAHIETLHDKNISRP